MKTRRLLCVHTDYLRWQGIEVLSVGHVECIWPSLLNEGMMKKQRILRLQNRKFIVSAERKKNA